MDYASYSYAFLWSTNGKLVLWGPVVRDSRGATMPLIRDPFGIPNHQTLNHSLIWGVADRNFLDQLGLSPHFCCSSVDGAWKWVERCGADRYNSIDELFWDS